MAFGLLYLTLALFGKVGSDIKYNLDRISAREQAKERNNDTYIDGRGITRTVNGNQAVSFYRNDRGETLLLDKNGNKVKVYNEKKEEDYSIVTVKNCVDKYGNQLYCNDISHHKNCDIAGVRVVDLKTGKYLTIRNIERFENDIRKHFFYIDPVTLLIVRESDGEIELRNRGNKFSPSKDEINRFIEKYNKEQKERYEPIDQGKWRCGDISMESIKRTIWNQKKEV